MHMKKFKILILISLSMLFGCNMERVDGYLIVKYGDRDGYIPCILITGKILQKSEEGIAEEVGCIISRTIVLQDGDGALLDFDAQFSAISENEDQEFSILKIGNKSVIESKSANKNSITKVVKGLAATYPDKRKDIEVMFLKPISN